MNDDPVIIAVLILAAIPWTFAVIRAIRQELDVTPLAFLLIILAALGSGALTRIGFAAGGGLAFLAAGVILLVFWPKPRAR